ncbi:hypothetical protein [Streptomyces sp. NPDC047108]|uniref:allene oxide cyclase barrel-like domain-containing protein n=1 Tax=Streptomyces sp. NPDC047108 TaxID=3155025 RepID=UPI0033C4838F
MRRSLLFAMGAVLCVTGFAAPAAAVEQPGPPVQADPSVRVDPSAQAGPLVQVGPSQQAGPSLQADSAKGFERIELTTRTTSHYNDSGPDGPSAGDEVLSTGVLLKDGRPVGEFGNECSFLAADAQSQTLQCVESWSLEDKGELTSQALTEQTSTTGPRAWTAVITGGTGRFLGAEGFIVTRKDTPEEGTDRVTIFLKRG